MSTKLGTKERPLRVAIVGSGPSGFYAAEALLTSNHSVEVDMFERLPVPFGLVRYGVAPDHQKIKNVIKIYEKIALHPSFSFFGNVSVGTDFKLQDLRNFYDAIIFACGAESDKRLGIHGEDLAGSHTATEFVAWYNGHPDYRKRKFDLSHEDAMVVGQGNVAMDVCRILARTVEELKTTDIAQHALDLLATSKIKRVHLVGRRGPAQAAFTPPEIKEFGELKDCDVIVDPKDLQLNPESQKELADIANAPKRKNYEILKHYAATPPKGKKRQLIIHFLKSPMELKGDGRVEKAIMEHNRLSGEAGHQKAKLTGDVDELKCGIFFRSVGYRGVAVANVPFDHEAGTILNRDGRILTTEGNTAEGLYCVGWIKRGSMGVIGTNKADSIATVNNLFADLAKLPACQSPQKSTVVEFLNKHHLKFVTFQDWQKIDAAEIERGKKVGKPREKFVEIKEMLAAIKK